MDKQICLKGTQYACPCDSCQEASLIEALADKVHASWAMTTDGQAIIPTNLVQRWQRQIATPYGQLTEQEKQSDREQVALMLPAIRGE